VTAELTFENIYQAHDFAREPRGVVVCSTGVGVDDEEALCIGMLQCVEVWCSVLQCVAVCCSVV